MGRKVKDRTGEVFGLLTAIEDTGKRKYGKPIWKCICECGNFNEVPIYHLRSGHTKSCGCLVGSNKKHGHSPVISKTPTYISWDCMKQRCLNPKNISYKNYGGRGIMICERWMVFENFLADMGERPEGMTLDRIDNDGHYEPSNCKWSTWNDQASNRRPKGVDNVQERIL